MTTIDQAFIRAYLQETAPKTAQSAVAPQAVPANQSAPVEAVTEPAHPEMPASEPAKAQFRPMLQVDGFAWSERATSLRLAAGIQVDRLADGLAGGIAEGQNVVAIAGCQRCQGCTTLLLCAAKRLADRGLKVAMVDADFSHPAMAARLGLLPEAGLEAVLGGRLPLEDAAIESIADRMTVLPLAAPCSRQAAAPEGTAVVSAAIDLLRRHYDLVMVDLGEIARRTQPDTPTDRVVPRWVDAVVLVQDVRSTPRAEMVETARRAEAEGIVNLGVVENFV